MGFYNFGKIKISLIKNYIINSLIFIYFFFQTRNYPFSQYSFLISTSLFLVFIVSGQEILTNIKKSPKFLQDLLLLNLIYLLINLVYSIFIRNNNPGYAIRFFVTFVLLLIAYFYKPNFKIFINIFLFISIIHTLILIGFEFYLLINQTPVFNAAIRNYFMNNNYGDIYIPSYSFGLFRVAMRGNEILPIALFVSKFYVQSQYRKLLEGLLLTGILISGNIAFLISVIFFYISNVLVLQKKVTLSKFLLIVLFFAGCLVFYGIYGFGSYVEGILENKNISSMPTRFVQVEILINSTSDKIYEILLGEGLGNVLEHYSRDAQGVYYEIQAAYFLNQSGFIYFFIFVFSHVVLSFYFLKNREILIIYLSYILYGISNPYILNSFHIMVIVVLLSLKKVTDEKKTNISSIKLYKVSQ